MKAKEMEEKAQQMALEAEAKAKVAADLQREVCLYCVVGGVCVCVVMVCVWWWWCVCVCVCVYCSLCLICS